MGGTNVEKAVPVDFVPSRHRNSNKTRSFWVDNASKAFAFFAWRCLEFPYFVHFRVDSESADFASLLTPRSPEMACCQLSSLMPFVHDEMERLT